MNSSCTSYEFIAPLVRNVLQPILPLEYANATSYMEQLNMVCKKVVELVDAQNKEPEVIYNLVKTMYSEGSLQGIVADLVSDIAINVKYPPAGITPAAGDGTTNDYPTVKACFDYAKTLKTNTTVYFPAGIYLLTEIGEEVLDLPFIHDTYTIGIMGAPGAKLNINTLSMKTGGEVRGVEFNFILPSSEKTPVCYIKSDAGNLNFSTNANIQIQGDGNYITFRNTRSYIPSAIVSIDNGKQYNSVVVCSPGYDSKSDAVAPATGNNSLTVLGYSKDENYFDYDLTVQRNFHLTTNGESSLKFSGNVSIESPISQWDSSEKKAANDTLFASENNKTGIASGSPDDDTDYAAVICQKNDDGTRSAVLGASGGLMFGNAYTETGETTEAPAKAFTFYPAKYYDASGNVKESAVVLKNDNTVNMSVCFFNNVGYETDFIIPVKAEYLKSDDVISIELSGYCEDGANYPAKLTIGGQEYIFGRGDFYAKFLITPLQYEDSNLKISGFSVDSGADYQQQKTYFFNKQLYADLDSGNVLNFIFGHSGSKTQRVIYWSAVAHYN